MSNINGLSATTEREFKCANCGNMFPVAQATCDVCGFHCNPDACRVVEASNEGY